MATGVITLRRVADFIRNAGAFAVYLVVQQMLLLPYLAVRCGEEVFCRVILFITVVNVVGSIVGDDIGNCLLVRSEEYRRRGLSPLADMTAILVRMGLLTGAVILAVNGIRGWGWGLTVAGIVCVCLCALRFFVSVQFRRQERFDLLIWLSVVYAAGTVPGLLIFRCGGPWVLIFTGAELLAALGILWMSRRRGTCYLALSGITDEYRRSWAVYLQLAGVSALLLGALYLDRFMLYGMLDAAVLAVYFAVSMMSKMIFMLGNPLYSFLLAAFSRVGGREAGRVIRFGVAAAALLLAVGCPGSLVLMVAGMKIFYPQYFTAAVPLFAPLALAGGAGMTVVVLRSLALRFWPKWQLLHNTAVYAAALGGGGWAMTRWWSIAGMSWAVAAGQLVQALGLLWILAGRKRGGDDAV